MNIFQFESLNLEFICKRYEINKFCNLKYKIRSKSMIKLKVKGLSARIQGPTRENQGQWVGF
jgi:glutathione peroxidase-family protein